ncbi:MAG: glycosyltransferase family 2 protein [Nitrososphaerota archaeon]|nr:glycosyltransferase family 2 protein [Nitrososphaerota archaeon]
MPIDPTISVVVTSYGSGSTQDVLKLIYSLGAQTYEQTELIFIGEGLPELCNIVRERGESVGIRSIDCSVIPVGGGASAARNLGIKKATGEIIAFLDDDVILSPSWAAEVKTTFAEYDSIIGAIGPVMPFWDDQKMSWLPAELNWLVSCTGWFNKTGVIPIRGHTWSSNASFKREAFSNGLEFSEKLGPKGGVPGWMRDKISEDVELSMRIQSVTHRPVVFNSEIKVWKRIRKGSLSWRRLMNCALGIGASRVAKEKMLRNNHNDALDAENDLLRRILLGLIPQTVAKPRNLKFAARILTVTLITTACLAMGYMSEKLS